jgi:hypothetical protein
MASADASEKTLTGNPHHVRKRVVGCDPNVKSGAEAYDSVRRSLLTTTDGFKE